MFTINKIIIGVAATLALTLGIQTYMMHRQSVKLGAATTQIASLSNKVVEANHTVAVQGSVAKITDETITSATKRINTNTEKGTAIKAVVDNITKRVVNENLPSTVANAAYINSMWDAYCTADKSDSACSSRQPVN